MSGVPLVQLGEIASLQAGVGFPLDLQGRTSGDYPVAKVGDISRVGRSGHSVLFSADNFVSEDDLQRLRVKPVPAGSILFAKIGEAIRQNHRVIAGCPLLIDNNAMAAVPTANVASRFLYHFLRTIDFYRLAAATTVPALRKSELVKIQVPLPPLPEQRRVAGILDQAHALRAQRRGGLVQLDTLAQSIFLDMFGDPATNPKGWARAALRELGKVTTGGTPPSVKPGMFGGAIPFVTPGDLESDESVKRSVTEAGANESGTVAPGATLVCCIGATIGKIGKAPVRSAFNQQINAVEWGKTVDADFGFAVLRFFKPTIIAWGTSTTLPILKKSTFERIEIPVPPLNEQREFSRRVVQFERLRSSCRAFHITADELFDTLQSRAFRGEL